ncbi:MAG: VanW family protein [Deltaproteobacteria bacterium]|nr:VanW family protein [Deltaproteobacteria bacterium]MBN2670524.1 VanW family protein [Deltaproteobacteria bacterium]
MKSLFQLKQKIILIRARKPLMFDIVLLLLLLVFGASAAMLIHAPWQHRSDEKPAFIIVNGQKISVDATGRNELRQLARNQVSGEVVLSGGGISHRATWASLGARAEHASIDRILSELALEDSAATKYLMEETGGEMSVRIPVSLDSGAAVEALVAIKEKLDRMPRNAKFDFKSNRVAPEKNGLSLDVYGTLERMDDALQQGNSTVAMKVETVKPDVVAAELKNIDVDSVAGFYETPYSRMKKDEDRTYNVSLGASILDGHVIMPGELFSFNDTLGDRSQARGFRYAPVIAAGKIVEGMGGGTCQVASTLYAAAFFAGLTIEDRVPHSRPSSYIKLGLDATVSYPSKDLKIRNPFEYPVVIHFKVEEGNARVEIRAQERPFTVSLLRKIIGTTPYPVRVVSDANLPLGKEVVTQRGVPGYKVSRYRIIERDKVAYRFQSFDRYPPTVEFVHKGTSPPGAVNEKEAPKPDMHKPYRASASLRMVQGQDLWYEKTHN